jgi:hypothetical protein
MEKALHILRQESEWRRLHQGRASSDFEAGALNALAQAIHLLEPFAGPIKDDGIETSLARRVKTDWEQVQYLVRQLQIREEDKQELLRSVLEYGDSVFRLAHHDDDE